MSRSRLRPAEPLIYLHLLRRDGVVLIQALGTSTATCITPEGLTPIGNSVYVLRAQMINQHVLSTSCKALHSNITDIEIIIVILVVRGLVWKARDVGTLRSSYTCRQEDQNHGISA